MKQYEKTRQDNVSQYKAIWDNINTTRQHNVKHFLKDNARQNKIRQYKKSQYKTMQGKTIQDNPR